MASAIVIHRKEPVTSGRQEPSRECEEGQDWRTKSESREQSAQTLHPWDNTLWFSLVMLAEWRDGALNEGKAGRSGTITAAAALASVA